MSEYTELGRQRRKLAEQVQLVVGSELGGETSSVMRAAEASIPVVAAEIADDLRDHGYLVAAMRIRARFGLDEFAESAWAQREAWRGELVSRIAQVYSSQGDRGKSPGEVADEMLSDGWGKQPQA